MFRKRQNSNHYYTKYTKPEIEWSDPSRPYQEFLVGITRWDYKVFPDMRGTDWEDWGTCIFQFEGITTIGETERIIVGGEIEALSPEVTTNQSYAGDEWRHLPETIEGCGSLITDMYDWISLGLYCKPAALDSVYRAFHSGLSSSSSTLIITVRIGYPDPVEAEFWKSEWRQKHWEVRKWGILSAAWRSQP